MDYEPTTLGVYQRYYEPDYTPTFPLLTAVVPVKTGHERGWCITNALETLPRFHRSGPTPTFVEVISLNVPAMSTSSRRL